MGFSEEENMNNPDTRKCEEKFRPTKKNCKNEEEKRKKMTF